MIQRYYDSAKKLRDDALLAKWVHKPVTWFHIFVSVFNLNDESYGEFVETAEFDFPEGIKRPIAPTSLDSEMIDYISGDWPGLPENVEIVSLQIA